MFQPGFLDTRAPFFMDFVMIMVALLPVLVGIAILFAKKRDYKSHAFTHKLLYIVSIIVVGYFEYGVRAGGGYEAFVKDSAVSHNYAFYVLIFHIIVAVIGFVIWTYTIIIASGDRKRRTLPGMYSASHKKAGIKTYIWIWLTAITGVWVYVLLFMV
jgi:putative membrane protein